MYTLSSEALAARKANGAISAAKRRAKRTCIRGHNKWRIRIDGRRECITCKNDRAWYKKHI